MNSLYGSKLHIENIVNFETAPIQDSFVVDDSMQFNAARLCLKAYGALDNLDILMLANGLRHPFKDIPAGTVIIVPEATYVKSIAMTITSNPTAIKLKHAKQDGNTITF
jgi:hypothetical protein